MLLNMKLNASSESFIKRFAGGLLKTVGILLSLYLFVCSLTFLSTSFRILGGRNLSSLFSDSEVLSNPIVGVMIGILVTVLVQSSATSTSIIVSLVSAGVEVRHAVPMIFGSNVGTSVTNTIVSMTQAGDRESFRRAFAAATVHDMFNWLSVVVMVILEVSTGALEHITGKIVDVMPLDDGPANFTVAAASEGKEGSGGGPDLLKALTKPFTDKIVQLDKKILLGWSFNKPEYENITSLLKSDCDAAKEGEPCDFLLSIMGQNGWGLNDTWLGLFLLAFSLALLCGCLIALMKILNSMLGSQMAGFIQKTINAEIPYVPWLTGYLFIAVGAVITIIVRSSSVFTSTLTPLCGAGLVTLETAYPMTLGSNIGTTTTSILASLAAEGKYLKPSVQIALVHLFFNIIGILIFYPIPIMRIPIPMAKRLGDLTARYRWFAGFYLVFMFFLLPALVFLLSLAGTAALYMVLAPLLLLAIVVGLINLVQNTRPHWLPSKLRNWHFLPLWMRSLQPIDNQFQKMACCAKCRHVEDDEEGAVNSVGNGTGNGMLVINEKAAEMVEITPIIRNKMNQLATPTMVNGRIIGSSSELESLVNNKHDSHVITICGGKSNGGAGIMTSSSSASVTSEDPRDENKLIKHNGI